MIAAFRRSTRCVGVLSTLTSAEAFSARLSTLSAKDYSVRRSTSPATSSSTTSQTASTFDHHRNFHSTSSLAAHPGIIAALAVKKMVVYQVAKTYGIPRLYRRLLEFDRRIAPQIVAWTP